LLSRVDGVFVNSLINTLRSCCSNHRSRTSLELPITACNWHH